MRLITHILGDPLPPLREARRYKVLAKDSFSPPEYFNSSTRSLQLAGRLHLFSTSTLRVSSNFQSLQHAFNT